MKAISSKKAWGLCAMLLVITGAVYSPVVTYDFVPLDDDVYVYENPRVLAGLTSDSIRWAFTADLLYDSSNAEYWRPLNFLSHMLDVELFGLHAGGHHLTNVLFHLISVALLFLLLSRTTQKPFPSLFVAGVFALHPLQIESVAWVTERKDMLSVSLGLATLVVWTGYVKRRGAFRYGTSLVLFALALMAKPMLVTLPGVMLLMDVWPLRRMKITPPGAGKEKRKKKKVPSSTPTRLITEKIPFFLLTTCSILIMTVFHPGHLADTSLQKVTWMYRISHSLVSYVVYLRKIVWPNDLASLYPAHPVPGWQVAGCALILLGITIWAVRSLPRRPYVPVGWFWFVGMLLPVIGLLNIGYESVADRFTYMPKIGVLIMAAWGLAEVAERLRYGRPVVVTASCAVLVACTVATSIQLPHWKNGVTLLSRAVEVSENNWLAHNNLGQAYQARGELESAFEHFKKTIEINPKYALAHNNLGNILKEMGRHEEAQEHYRKASEFETDPFAALLSHGIMLVETGKYKEALVIFQKALQSRPRSADVHNGLGIVYANLGDFSKAEKHFRETLRLNPSYTPARNNLNRMIGER